MPDSTSPVWHPFTQHGAAPPPLLVERAEGACLHLAGGRPIIDGISSWWVNTHGHCHPRIVAAVAEQARHLEQVIFAGFTHAPAERLARRLIERVPAGLAHVFFSDSGSTAVEVAVKMAVGYWHHRGEARHRIVALEHAYHGDTFGAMAVGHRGGFTSPYWPMLFTVDHLPFPAPGEEGRCTATFAALLDRHGAEIAALIVEPLVLGAGGMLMYPPAVLADLVALCRARGIPVIADEVMTGFGRTGTFFACEQAGVAPDLMCLSKGLTGGFLPMGVTLATSDIFAAFYAESRERMFFHSSSFTGNALAAAAALASLDVWDTEPVFERIAAITTHHARRLRSHAAHPMVASVRQTGTIAAVELGPAAGRPTAGSVNEAGYFAAIGPRLYDFYLKRGVLLRPLGNVIYVLPPYCITEEELDRIHDVIAESLDHIGH